MLDGILVSHSRFLLADWRQVMHAPAATDPEFGEVATLVVNCVSIPHDAHEVVWLDPDRSMVSDDWALKDR